jgi:hypothetical protein
VSEGTLSWAIGCVDIDEERWLVGIDCQTMLMDVRLVVGNKFGSLGLNQMECLIVFESVNSQMIIGVGRSTFLELKPKVMQVGSENIKTDISVVNAVKRVGMM